MLNHLVLQYKCILPQQCLSPEDRFTVSIILFTGLEDENITDGHVVNLWLSNETALSIFCNVLTNNVNSIANKIVF